MWSHASTIAVVLATITPVVAQPPAPCSACARGDELVEKLALQPLRAIAGELAELGFADPLTPKQYKRVLELRRRTPALARAGAVDDNDLAAIATALCRTLDGTCTETTWRALQCLADRCEVALPSADPRGPDVLTVSSHCRNTAASHKRVAPIGVGFDFGAGYQRSSHPTDGHASSVGIEARVRIADRFGTVARIDHISGRDEAIDADGDGDDDMSTGSITRISALGGPSIVFGDAQLERGRRFLRLDLLGGYISTRSQPDESGPAAGFDLVHQIAVFRLGIRFVQGFGGAQDTTMVIGHLGIVTGGAPPSREEDDECTPRSRSRSRSRSRLRPRPPERSRLALGGDFPLLGYGFSPDLGVLAPNLGVELAWHLTRKLDALARADLLLSPGYERERTIHQAVLAGVRIDHKDRNADTGFFTTLASGYTHGSGISTLTGAGPIGDVSVGWGFQNVHGAAYFRLHARFGIHPDIEEYRAIFLSGGFEVRLDPDRWEDRRKE